MTVILIGWFGTALYLINHGYISVNKNWKKPIYYTGNAIAASCLVLSSYYSNSWQAIVINCFWAFTSVLLLCGVDLSTLKIDKRIFHLIIAVMLLFFFGEVVAKQQLNLALLGWVSAFTYSGCYLLFSAEKMLPRNYLCWNAFASLIILPQLWLDQNWPVVGMQICWAMISIYGAARRQEEVHLVQ